MLCPPSLMLMVGGVAGVSKVVFPSRLRILLGNLSVARKTLSLTPVHLVCRDPRPRLSVLHGSARALSVTLSQGVRSCVVTTPVALISMPLLRLPLVSMPLFYLPLVSVPLFPFPCVSLPLSRLPLTALWRISTRGARVPFVHGIHHLFPPISMGTWVYASLILPAVPVIPRGVSVGRILRGSCFPAPSRLCPGLVVLPRPPGVSA